MATPLRFISLLLCLYIIRWKGDQAFTLFKISYYALKKEKGERRERRLRKEIEKGEKGD